MIFKIVFITRNANYRTLSSLFENYEVVLVDGSSLRGYLPSGGGGSCHSDSFATDIREKVKEEGKEVYITPLTVEQLKKGGLYAKPVSGRGSRNSPSQDHLDLGQFVRFMSVSDRVLKLDVRQEKFYTLIVREAPYLCPRLAGIDYRNVDTFARAAALCFDPNVGRVALVTNNFADLVVTTNRFKAQVGILDDEFGVFVRRERDRLEHMPEIRE